MRRGRWLAILGLATSATALAVFAACLPELPEVNALAPHGAAAVCGDGVIDLDAGEQCDPGEAGAIGCGACRVQCEGGAIDPSSGHCYFAAPRAPSDPASFLVALRACRDAGAHVSTFVSDEELAFAAAVGDRSSDFWVGMFHSLTNGDGGYAPSQSIEPGWSPACSGCFANLPHDAGDPHGNDCLVATRADLGWVQSACDDNVPRDTICEREPVGSRSAFCIGGVCFDISRTAGTKRYLLVPVPVRAEEARATCESAAGGLAVFDSREEREQIAREIAAQRVVGEIDSFWIGLHGDDAGAWMWEGDASAPLPWGEGEPSHGSALAFVRIELGAVDSELAHAASPDDVHPALCQIAVK